MAGYAQAAKAVISRIRPAVPDWETLWYPKKKHEVPAVRLAPDPTRHVGYEETPGTWYLRVELCVDGSDEEAGYLLLSDLTDQYGPLISRLLDPNPVPDALWDLCGLAIGVPDGRRWTPPDRWTGRMSCDIGLTIGSG